MIEKTEIRPVSDGDWPQLWRLLQMMGHTDAELAAQQRVAKISRQDEHYLCVAVRDDIVIGYAWAQDYGAHIRSGRSTARLNDLFVAPAWRRRGAARALLAAVTEWAKERGVTWLQWQASASAIPFYERLGLTGDPCPDPDHPFFELQFRPYP